MKSTLLCQIMTPPPPPPINFYDFLWYYGVIWPMQLPIFNFYVFIYQNSKYEADVFQNMKTLAC